MRLALPASFQLVYVASSTASGTNTGGDAALDVIDVSNTLSIQGLNRVTVSGAAAFLGFAYDNLLLFLTGSTAGVPDFAGTLTLTTMDITDVRNPLPVATIDTKIPTTGAFHVQPFGSSIFAIVNNPPQSDPGGPASLMIVDASNTQSPVLYPFATQFGLSGLAFANDFLLAPNQNGLNIYKIQFPK